MAIPAMPLNTTPFTGTDQPLIQTRSLVKSYNLGGETIHAVNGVSLSIAKGEYVAIMGTSGSGKSTFMNMIGCLDVPTSGQVLIDGTPTASMSSDDLATLRNEKIGFVFQQFNLLARTSSIDNVAVPLIYAGVDKAERRERATAKLIDMGLGERLLNTPAKLSGGQQQRVAIARALVTEPLVLLADEPTGALDTRTSEEIMEIFETLNADGITVIIVTHEDEIADHAKRRIEFRDGKVVEDRAVEGRTIARATTQAESA
ncbi:ABC transporter ATP-binding protein [Erythrobacter sp. SCSIO 43205]|uniref:ABC transporter ATP-binding protein n=1 Tax=Erythrobacter sp. SCSIO 43205 TaxID=2779361 RepID=UPI00210441FA|nr:ABC transporter ATP-binding protein [Erythrobacter sp. SCSIO 43205]